MNAPTPRRLPPEAAPPARLCFGHVVHTRIRPKRHAFRYRVFALLLDIDRLDELDAASALFSVGRFNLFGFNPADHGPRDGRPLRSHVEGLLRRAGIGTPAGRIDLLCYPRVLGYVFNPLSIYYCHDKAGRLTAMVHEVHNTFGDAHSYVVPVADMDARGRIPAHACAKRMHVSPFAGMAARYHFTLRRTQRALSVHIREDDAHGPFLLAGFNAALRPFSSAALARAFIRYPLMTVKVIAAIHFEALRLWRKGVKLQPRPADAPPPWSAGAAIAGPAAAPGPARAGKSGYTSADRMQGDGTAG